MKVLITGTHFTPAVAVLKEFKKRKSIEIVYVGRKTTLEGDLSQSVESKIFPNLGVKFISIITGRLQRNFTLYTIPSVLKLPIGFIQSIYIILSEKPDVILSFGGYVSVPIVIAGWLFSVPIIIHEQTVVSGLANKISAIFASRVALSFDTDSNSGKKNVLITGNPIREEIKFFNKFELAFEYKEIFRKAKAEKLPVILVIGGNQGSHTINLIIEKCLPDLSKIGYVIHQTGDSKFKDFERLQESQNEQVLSFGNKKYLVKKWIGKEVGKVLSKVDMVISRAGINTLSELAFLGKPALVIPFEPLYQDEQNKNAKYFEKFGLVKILPQKKLSSKNLVGNIKIVLNNLNSFKEKAEQARKAIIPDAAERLALETVILSNDNK